VNDRTAALSAGIDAILARCERDPAFFLFNFAKTRDEHDSINPLKPFPRIPYLEWTLNRWHNGPKLQYVAKSRQLMISWLLCGYAMWTAMFRPFALVLLQSKKEEDTAPFIYEKSANQARISLMMTQLPSWLQVCRRPEGGYAPMGSLNEIFSYCCVTLPNGSQILGIPQGASQVEGKVPTLFLGDECSLQPEWATAIAAAKPALDGDSRGICVGTMRMPSDYGDEISPSWDVDADSVMRGVSEFRSKSGVYGIRIHYSADPAKDPETEGGARWKNAQLASGAYRGGEKGWQWQQHMEINPLSRAGTLCIPMFQDIKHKIVIDDIPPNAMWNWAFDGGFDWGVRNDTVFHIYGMSPNGRRYLVYEFAAPAGDCGGIPGIARILRRHPLFDKVNGNIQAEPMMWRHDQNTVGGLTTMAQLFTMEGVHLCKARARGEEADRIALDRLLYYYWAGHDRETFDPLLFICRSCEATIRTFPTLMYEEWSEALAPEKSLKEKMKDLHTDSWDAFKFAEVAWPNCPVYRAPDVYGSMDWRKKEEKKRIHPERTGDLWRSAR